MQITKIDIHIGVYLLYGILSGLFISELPPDNYIFIKWAVITIVYILLRLLPTKVKEFILHLIIAVGAIQSIIAIAQQLGYVESKHSMFAITGFLGNPGQLGGFQAVAFIMALATLVKAEAKKYRVGLTIIMLLIGYSVILADSRAGVVAVIFGVLTIYWSQVGRFVSQHKKAIIPIAAACIVTATLLFNYRSESANSRLLIWRVCTEMIADNPILGSGVGTFNDSYMLHQANYFETNEDSRFTMVADNVAYPYNELLHIWIEQGLIGVLLFLLFIYFALQTSNLIVRGSLVALLIFSMFSYPSYVYPLMALFPVLLALSNQNTIALQRWRLLAIVVVPIIIVIGVMVYKEAKFVKDSRKHLLQLLATYNSESTNYFKIHSERIMQYSRLNTLGIIAMAKHPELGSEKMLTNVIPSCENWCDIGLIYQSRGEYEEAEMYYREAAYMIPTRFKPKYYLWKMYVELGKNEIAIEIAIKLLNQNLKTENTFTLRSKVELRSFLENNNLLQ